MLDTINTLNYGATHFKLVRMVDAMVWGSFTPIHPTPLKRGGDLMSIREWLLHQSHPLVF